MLSLDEILCETIEDNCSVSADSFSFAEPWLVMLIILLLSMVCWITLELGKTLFVFLLIFSGGSSRCIESLIAFFLICCFILTTNLSRLRPRKNSLIFLIIVDKISIPLTNMHRCTRPRSTYPIIYLSYAPYTIGVNK